MPLFLLLVAVPLIEIALFVQIGGAIGLWPTLAIVLLTAAAGTWLLRREGRVSLARLQMAFETGADPSQPLAQGAAVLAAGLLLLTPGFFTDGLGFVLLVPAGRALILRLLARALSRHVTVVRQPPGRRPPDDAPIEADYTVLDDDEDHARKGNGRS